MRRLTYENSRGEKIVFYLSPFLITSLTGIGEVEAELQSQKAPYQDGNTYIDTILEPRFIYLEGTITETDLVKIKDYRRQISRVCNPKLGLGKITLELDGDLKQINGALDGGVIFPERGATPSQTFMITWKCPNPYWKSPTIQEEPMAAFIGLFEFPFDDEFEVGFEGGKRILLNEGDVSSPVQITFNGPAVNPEVRNNTTGKMIKVNRSLNSGDVLTINTEIGNKFVEINGENAFHWIDLDSEFWSLEVGENEIEYRAESGQDEATLLIEWKNMYVGV